MALCEHPTGRLQALEGKAFHIFCMDCGCDVAENAFQMVDILTERLKEARGKIESLDDKIDVLLVRLRNLEP